MPMNADWYADPLGRFEGRWFDGFDWTRRVSDKGFEAVDPDWPTSGPASPPLPSVGSAHVVGSPSISATNVRDEKPTAINLGAVDRHIKDLQNSVPNVAHDVGGMSKRLADTASVPQVFPVRDASSTVTDADADADADSVSGSGGSALDSDDLPPPPAPPPPAGRASHWSPLPSLPLPPPPPPPAPSPPSSPNEGRLGVASELMASTEADEPTPRITPPSDYVSAPSLHALPPPPALAPVVATNRAAVPTQALSGDSHDPTPHIGADAEPLHGERTVTKRAESPVRQVAVAESPEKSKGKRFAKAWILVGALLVAAGLAFFANQRWGADEQADNSQTSESTPTTSNDAGNDKNDDADEVSGDDPESGARVEDAGDSGAASNPDSGDPDSGDPASDVASGDPDSGDPDSDVASGDGVQVGSVLVSNGRTILDRLEAEAESPADGDASVTCWFAQLGQSMVQNAYCGTGSLGDPAERYDEFSLQFDTSGGQVSVEVIADSVSQIDELPAGVTLVGRAASAVDFNVESDAASVDEERDRDDVPSSARGERAPRSDG